MPEWVDPAEMSPALEHGCIVTSFTLSTTNSSHLCRQQTMRPLLAVLALTALHATASSLLAYTHPLGLLKFGGDSPLDSFATSAATVAFVPGLHTCGTLLVLSAAGLSRADLDDVSARGALVNEWDSSPSKIIENAATDEAVVAWAKGWRKSCGKGESMREVRVAKLVVDGLGGEGKTRDDALDSLGELLLGFCRGITAGALTRKEQTRRSRRTSPPCHRPHISTWSS